jgi:hypothetical protein
MEEDDADIRPASDGFDIEGRSFFDSLAGSAGDTEVGAADVLADEAPLDTVFGEAPWQAVCEASRLPANTEEVRFAIEAADKVNQQEVKLEDLD